MEPHRDDVDIATTAGRARRPHATRRSVFTGLALPVLLAVVLVAGSAGPAGAATVEYRSGTTAAVPSYGRAHCRPAYLNRHIEIGSPLTSENPYIANPGVFTVGGGQRVLWTPFLQRWTGSTWATVWVGSNHEDGAYGSTAHWGSVFVDVWALRGGGAGYYRAGGIITWVADANHFGGQQAFLLSTGEYLVGGGANGYLSTRLSSPYCFMG